MGITTIVVLLIRLIRGRHRTQNNARKDRSSSSQSSLATEVNINNTLRVESNPQACIRGDSLATMKKPNEFNERIDVETWLVQLEIYLEKCVDKGDWFDVTLSHINVNCLKDLTIAELRCKQNNYQLLKEFLVNKYASKSSYKNLELTDFVNRKQSPNESVKEYAEALQIIAGSVLSSTPSNSID